MVFSNVSSSQIASSSSSSSSPRLRPLWTRISSLTRCWNLIKAGHGKEGEGEGEGEGNGGEVEAIAEVDVEAALEYVAFAFSSVSPSPPSAVALASFSGSVNKDVEAGVEDTAEDIVSFSFSWSCILVNRLFSYFFPFLLLFFSLLKMFTNKRVELS